MTQQYCLASRHGFRLQYFPTRTSSLMPPWGCLPTVNGRPHHGIALQSLWSSSQLLCFLGTCTLMWGTYGCSKDDLCGFSFNLDCHRSLASLSASNVSPLSQTVTAMWGLDLQFPHPPRAGPVLLTLLFFSPPSFILLYSSFFSFIPILLLCLVSYSLFQWSGTADHSQLVFCKIFCV